MLVEEVPLVCRLCRNEAGGGAGLGLLSSATTILKRGAWILRAAAAAAYSI